MKIIMLGCFIVLARGQAEFPCCGPDKQWEADEGLIVGTTTGGVGSLTTGFIKLSYDDDKQMVNSDGEYETNGQKAHVRVLQDFKNMKEYTVIGNKCTISSTQYSFIPSCVPAGSTKLPSGHYGLPKSPINVDTYKAKLMKLDVVITVLPLGEKTCLPMGEVLYGGGPSSGQMMTLGFTNYTSGISDPSVFTVPPNCTHIPVVQMTKRSVGRYPIHLFH